MSRMCSSDSWITLIDWCCHLLGMEAGNRGESMIIVDDVCIGSHPVCLPFSGPSPHQSYSIAAPDSSVGFPWKDQDLSRTFVPHSATWSGRRSAGASRHHRFGAALERLDVARITVETSLAEFRKNSGE